MNLGVGIGLGFNKFRGSASESYFLDSQPNAFAAYSLEALSSSYNGFIVTVVRASDLQPLDVGLTPGGKLNTSAIINHCGGSVGRITKFYDQSGQGEHVEQGTFANAPRIYDGANIDTLGGKPAAFFDNNQWWSRQLKQVYNGPNSFLGVGNAQFVPNDGQNFFDGTGAGNRNAFFINGSTGDFAMYSDFQVKYSGVASNTNPFIAVGTFGSNQQLRFNGNLIINTGAPAGNFQGLNFGTFSGSNGAWRGYIQELIFWNADLSPNSIEISSTVKTRYNYY